MGKIDKINVNLAIVAPILGCSDREDCQAEIMPTERFASDVARLNEGKEPEYGLSVDMLLKDRITFMGLCDPHTCAETGACALKGAFVPTTPEMTTAQDANRRLTKNDMA